MAYYEYKVVPAPIRGAKLRGVRDERERFAHALGQLMNEMATQGWEYQRAETLPCEERKGLFKRETAFQNLLVFRRVQDTGNRAPVAAEAEPMSTATPAAPPTPLSAAPTPAAVAASLRPETIEGHAPRLGPIRPARPAPKQANVTPIPRVQPEGPSPRGE